MGCRVFQSAGASISGQYEGHSGVDVTADGGYDYIVAHSAGTVVWSQDGYGNAQGSSGNASYGNAVKIAHANGWSTLYAHMQYISVSTGQSVGRGQVLGYLGESGNAYGAHLHFEVRDSSGSALGPAAADYLYADLPGLEGGGEAAAGSSGGGGVSPEPEKLPITQAVVKSTEGKAGRRNKDLLSGNRAFDSGCEILIQSGKRVMAPMIEGDVTVEWKRSGSPGTLTFTCIKDKSLSFQEGSPVSLRVDGDNVFYGYVFQKKRDADGDQIKVTCYDQLRYLKNKDTLIYKEKRYSDLVKMIAEDYGLSCGEIEETPYVIDKRSEEATLFDILGNASDLTVVHEGALYVLYDDFGKLTLKGIESMKLPLLIAEASAGDYDYTSSIDKDVYSRVKIAHDNDGTGERELYVANDEKSQRNWGVLQLYETSDSGNESSCMERARLLLDYYGRKQRTLKLKKCFGDIRVRGGSSLVVNLNLGDLLVKNYMVVEKVKHTFSAGSHWMDLDVVGIRGEFVV